MAASLRTNWLIAIALVGGLLYLLAPVLTPFVAAALLAYIGDPLADRLQRLRLPRTLAVPETRCGCSRRRSTGTARRSTRCSSA